MDRCGKEGVVISVLKNDYFKSYTSFRVWLLFEAEETVIEVERGSLKCGEWVIVSPSKDASGYSRFKKIDPILPTGVLEDDTVQVLMFAWRISHENALFHIFMLSFELGLLFPWSAFVQHYDFRGSTTTMFGCE